MNFDTASRLPSPRPNDCCSRHRFLPNPWPECAFSSVAHTDPLDVGSILGLSFFGFLGSRPLRN